jgi:phosphatidylinositol-3-phosphatase
MKIFVCLLALSVCASASVSVSSPATGTGVSSPIHFVAKATTKCSKGVYSMGIYTAPYVLSYKVKGASMNTYLPLKAGTYRTMVQEWDRCGGASKTPITITVGHSTSSSSAMPSSSHVFVVVEENHSYSSVIGNSGMPYLNSLASKYAVATQYYANTHPSIGNYFMLTTGQTITNNDSSCATIGTDNVVRHLLNAGKTWKSYADSLPYAGYTGCGSGEYAKKHNPFAFFSDVANSSDKANLVPFTQFSKDLGNNALPQFSFIVPNLQHDGHDGSLQQADAWLKSNIAPLIASSTFQKDGVLIIVFDESVDSDKAHGGGHIAAVVIGPNVKPGYKSTKMYQHQNTLKTVMQLIGVQTYPGAAGNAASMSDFF